LILQLLGLGSVFDKVLDLIQLDITARFEPAGVMKDEAIGCWVLKLVFNVVFSALKNYIESSSSQEDTDQSGTDRC